MLRFLADYKRLGCVAALALGLGSCEQQPAAPLSATPIPQQPDALYYLNAKPSTKEAIEQLDPKLMTRMDVLKGQPAATYAHDARVNRVILAQTY
jgi:hypothetical protein